MAERFFKAFTGGVPDPFSHDVMGAVENFSPKKESEGHHFPLNPSKNGGKERVDE